MLQVLILGAAAGGGVPQWNCGCRNCKDARAGVIPAMSQSAVAVSPDGVSWSLLNASPDVRAQLAATPALAPTTLRGSPIKSVVLTNGDVDHVAGLLTLREKTSFDLWATADVHRTLAENPIMGVLDAGLVARKTFLLGDTIETNGLKIDCFGVPGKVPLYKEVGDVKTDEISEMTAGLCLEANRRRLAYIPGCAAITEDLLSRLETVDLLLFDGTVWENAEMPQLGVGEKTGRRMGHLPISGSEGSMAKLEKLNCRKIYIHVNNTNPVLQPNALERRQVEAAGWTIAQDGMEIRP